MKRKILSQMAILLFTCSSAIYAQPTPQGSASGCSCQTDSINISTGFNRTSGTVMSPGTNDPNWTVITVPTSSGLGTPSIPYVVTPDGAWGSSTPTQEAQMLTGSAWLSPFNTAHYLINNPPPDSPFVFQFQFCVCQQGYYSISGVGNADDEADLVLDGNIGSPIIHFPTWSSVIPFNQTVSLAPGTHYLTLRLRNTGSQVMGVCINGSVKVVQGGALIGYDCCNSGGGVMGRKWSDANCDGIIDSGDIALPHWVFTLNPGGYTATTDTLGYYYFTNVPAGTYTLSETAQPGWSPLQPSTSGSTTVTVTAGNTTNVDFLNSNCGTSQSCDLECYWRVTGNNTINDKVNYLGTNNKESLVFKTNSIQRAIINGTTGYGGIGITAPSTTLDVNGAPTTAPSGIRFEKLPHGQGNILVVDNNGFVYMSSASAKMANSSSEVTELQNQVQALQAEVDNLKVILNGVNQSGNSLNVSPNPTSGKVTASYQISGSYDQAAIRVTDNSGKTVLINPVTGSNGSVQFSIPGNISSGTLICTLVADGKVVAVQKLVLMSK